MTEVPMIEPIPAREVFTDGLVSLSGGQGVAKLAFASAHLDPTTGQGYRLINLRLTLPLAAVQGLHESLGQLLDKAREAEVEKRAV
jgi:hypothetical protein